MCRYGPLPPEFFWSHLSDPRICLIRPLFQSCWPYLYCDLSVEYVSFAKSIWPTIIDQILQIHLLRSSSPSEDKLTCNPNYERDSSVKSILELQIFPTSKSRTVFLKILLEYSPYSASLLSLYQLEIPRKYQNLSVCPNSYEGLLFAATNEHLRESTLPRINSHPLVNRE